MKLQREAPQSALTFHVQQWWSFWRNKSTALVSANKTADNYPRSEWRTPNPPFHFLHNSNFETLVATGQIRDISIF
jgi:hypothetical protein